MADENDDLLDPSEIEALLNSAGPGPGAGVAASDESGGGASPEISGGGATTDSSSALQSTDDLLTQAEADLAAAVAPTLDPQAATTAELEKTQPFQFQEFPASSVEKDDRFDLEELKDVKLDLHIELGRTDLLIEEVLQLKEGSVVPLDKLAGDPVDILVNGRLIARGEVLVLNDNFCVRVAEILAPEI